MFNIFLPIELLAVEAHLVILLRKAVCLRECPHEQSMQHLLFLQSVQRLLKRQHSGKSPHAIEIVD